MARILRTRRPHSPPRHDVLRSTDVLHSTDRAHRGTTIRSAGQPGRGLARSALRCSPTPGKHTDTTGTRPQISCAQRHRSTAHLSPIRIITPRTHDVMKRMSGTGRRGWREDPDEDCINAILIAEMIETKPDEGDREAPLKDKTRRRRRRRQR